MDHKNPLTHYAAFRKEITRAAASFNGKKRLCLTHLSTDQAKRNENGQISRSASDLWHFVCLSYPDAGDAE